MLRRSERVVVHVWVPVACSSGFAIGREESRGAVEFEGSRRSCYGALASGVYIRDPDVTARVRVGARPMGVYMRGGDVLWRNR